MAALLSLPSLAAVLVLSNPAPAPLVSVEDGVQKPEFCDANIEEERVVRVLEGMPPSWQPAATPDDSGEAVWAARCASCHGMSGNAKTHMGRRSGARDFSDPMWQDCRTDGDIRAAIERGVATTRMRSFKEHLTPVQVEELVKLIRGFDIRVSRGQSLVSMK